MTRPKGERERGQERGNGGGKVGSRGDKKQEKGQGCSWEAVFVITRHGLGPGADHLRIPLALLVSAKYSKNRPLFYFSCASLPFSEFKSVCFSCLAAGSLSWWCAQIARHQSHLFHYFASRQYQEVAILQVCGPHWIEIPMSARLLPPAAMKTARFFKHVHVCVCAALCRKSLALGFRQAALPRNSS